MSTTHDTGSGTDRSNLHRFVIAQDELEASSGMPVYDTALAELRHGRKKTHWMWFIFPQLAGLGQSHMSQQYAITSADEARRYLAHPVLGRRLRECVAAVMAVRGRSAYAIFGSPDDVKLQSSMTLFDAVAEDEPVFARVLDTYFGGERDRTTLQLLSETTSG